MGKARPRARARMQAAGAGKCALAHMPVAVSGNGGHPRGRTRKCARQKNRRPGLRAETGRFAVFLGECRDAGSTDRKLHDAGENLRENPRG